MRARARSSSSGCWSTPWSPACWPGPPSRTRRCWRMRTTGASPDVADRSSTTHRSGGAKAVVAAVERVDPRRRSQGTRPACEPFADAPVTVFPTHQPGGVVAARTACVDDVDRVGRTGDCAVAARSPGMRSGWSRCCAANSACVSCRSALDNARPRSCRPAAEFASAASTSPRPSIAQVSVTLGGLRPVGRPPW